MRGNVFDGVNRVENDVLVAGYIVEAHLVEIGIRVRLVDARSVVDCAAVVNNVCVKGAATKLGQTFVKDGVWIGENGEQRTARVAKVVNHKELAARHGEGAGAEDVPDVVGCAAQGGAHAEKGTGKGSKVDALEVVEDALCVEQADGVAGDEATVAVADHGKLCNLAAAGLNGVEFLLDLGADALAAQLGAIVGEGAAVALGAEDVELVGGVFGAESFGNVSHVVGIAPELLVGAERIGCQLRVFAPSCVGLEPNEEIMTSGNVADS